ncbi:MAG TPA: D-aminoacylase, partial [Longimicrobiales bacterium]|nr:D-aminoacylase [Longimicrobiales bacterium]
RTFVHTAGVAAAGTLLNPRVALGARRADLVLRGATVFDGSGAPGRELDVAVSGDRITGVGANLPAGSEEIDLRGLALAPGFIDIHSHADMSLFVNPNAESRIRQGVTLEVAGQDGGSVGPWSEDEYQETRERYREGYGADIDFRDPPGFLRGIDRLRPTVNVATMVGNGSVRGFVVGNENRPASDAELARMVQEVRNAINGGCVGLSSGLEYTPSGFADPNELVALASVMKGTGYPYASHMRNEDDRVVAAVEETVHVGRMAGVPVQVSHLKAQGQRNYWKQPVILDILAQARDAGVDAMFDCYPYIAYQTGLSNLFPTEMRAGGTRAFLARLRAPATAARLERACRDKVALLGDWNSVQITSAGATPWATGRKLGDLARERGVEPYALTLELLESNGGGVGMIGYGMSEENVAELLAHPLGMMCSDGGAYAPYGPLSTSSPHPRGYGSFPRLLGHYVRDAKALPLELAIHKVTGASARRLRLEGRGAIAPGAFADLVAFDPATVADRATYEAPHQYPVGIPVVIVNGVVTIRDGEQTGDRGGRGVRGAGRVQ